MSKRCVFIVLDSIGCGELPDAHLFNDVGSHTLGHVAEKMGEFAIPNLLQSGLGNIEGIPQLEATKNPSANFGRMIETAMGKDTATGHWEFVGCVPDEPFKTFMETGFPDDILDEFIERTGCGGILGNKAISGTVILEELGEEHMRTKKPIVYTSADPVFQIAAHESVIPLETLYDWCKIAYDIVIPRGLSRVIARPFIGEFPNFKRTHNRYDFTFPPPKETVLDRLAEAGVRVTGVGKIPSIYANRGISDDIHTNGNDDGVQKTLECIGDRKGLIFTNLVDFDSLYGHRRNPIGYGKAIERFDTQLPGIIDALDDGDLLIISADHGNDPTYRGTDHTREYVPLLTMVKGGKTGTDLGTRSTFADIGATIGDFFDVEWKIGESFLDNL